ncbi:diaminopimelate epimerase [Thermocrinis jamiesonii]|uniref:diaminopimelate epimerase n=1 Tax=Thermocrinis jamiesonii TaxID=1302351 RepID=UPI0004985450|nr:diaminopimelate epimerase [Thermocrinis jamiesonii]
MRFSKLQGSGNDFVIIDNRDKKVEEFLKDLNLDIKDFVKRVCAFHTGVGADGLILIENPKDKNNDFSWRFFNADGSEAEMCGNGSRCAVRFAFEEGIVGEYVRFETLAGVIQAFVLEKGRRIKVQLTQPKDYREVVLDVDGQRIEGSFINTGVPHFVVLVDDVEKIDVIKLGRLIRFHPSFQPKGTNVNFIQPISFNSIKIRTYERGVETETLACGTGATASALVAYKKGIVSTKPVEVKTRSGETLNIDFDEHLTQVFLEGSVVRVFDGFLRREFFEC